MGSLTLPSQVRQSQKPLRAGDSNNSRIPSTSYLQSDSFQKRNLEPSRGSEQPEIFPQLANLAFLWLPPDVANVNFPVFCYYFSWRASCLTTETWNPTIPVDIVFGIFFARGILAIITWSFLQNGGFGSLVCQAIFFIYFIDSSPSGFLGF